MAIPRKIPTTVKDPGLVAQRRAKIVDAATRLFLDRGFHKTSIRDIARACGLNVASLYMYVSSKEDILFLVAQHVGVEKTKSLEGVLPLDSDPVGATKLAFRRYCEVVDRHRPHVKLLYRELDELPPARQQIVLEAEEAVIRVFEDIVGKGMASGAFRRVEPRLVAHSAVFLAHMWAIKGWALKRYLNFDQFIQHQTQLLLRGLLRQPEPEK